MDTFEVKLSNVFLVISLLWILRCKIAKPEATAVENIFLQPAHQKRLLSFHSFYRVSSCPHPLPSPGVLFTGQQDTPMSSWPDLARCRPGRFQPNMRPMCGAWEMFLNEGVKGRLRLRRDCYPLPTLHWEGRRRWQRNGALGGTGTRRVPDGTSQQVQSGNGTPEPPRCLCPPALCSQPGRGWTYVVSKAHVHSFHLRVTVQGRWWNHGLVIHKHFQTRSPVAAGPGPMCEAFRCCREGPTALMSLPPGVGGSLHWGALAPTWPGGEGTGSHLECVLHCEASHGCRRHCHALRWPRTWV